MRVRSLVALCLVAFFGLANASPKSDIQTKIKEAMESYDLMDYAAATKLLNQALAIAKKGKLEKDPIVAKAHLSLGIVQYVNQDQDGAKLSFLSAVQIDPKIQIEAAYKSADMAKLLEQARKDATGAANEKDLGPAEPSGPSVDCSTVKGLQHTIVDTGKIGVAMPIEAYVGSDVTSTKIVAMYRPEKATEFTEVKLKKEGDCKYVGSIPGSAMKGSLVHYYVAALNDNGKPVAAKGTSGSPNIIELSAGPAGGDKEDPIGGGGGGGGSVSSNVTVGPKRPHVMLAIAGGTGFGYVAGETESMNTVKNCCIGNSWVVLQPELGYFVSPKLVVGIAARLGIPVGANVDGHATAAPGGLLRVRYGFSETGEGLRVMGQAGAGIMRNTIKLDNAEPGMDTDVVAQGPLLIGGGLGFTKRLAGNVSMMADLSVLAGIAVVKSIGPAPVLNNGVGADLSVGIQFGL